VRRDPRERRILFSFRGSSNLKSSRIRFEAALRADAGPLRALAARALRRVPPHPSGLGRVVVDIKHTFDSGAHYATRDQVWQGGVTAMRRPRAHGHEIGAV